MDHYEEARAALAAYDDPSIEIVGPDGYEIIGLVGRYAWIIEKLRPLVK